MIGRALMMMSVALSAAAADAQERSSAQIAARLSREIVSVDTTFRGAQVTIFGAVKNDRLGEGLREADIAIVVKSPPIALAIQEKRRAFGIWLNDRPFFAPNAPGFYFIASNRPLESLTEGPTRAQWRLGLDMLDADVDPGDAALEPARAADLRAALIRNRKQRGLYNADPTGVRIEEDAFFHAEIALPSSAPVGRYDVEVFLFRDGVLQDIHLVNFVVSRSGLERAVFEFAHRAPIAYGFAALGAALAAGWAASLVFHRA